MKFKKGHIFSEETKKRMSISAKKRCTLKWRKNLSELYSTPLPIDELKSLYDSGMTQEELAIHFRVSQKVIFGAMKRNKIKARIAKKRNQMGENNYQWKGNKASYKAFHQRLYRQLGKPKKCEVCGTDDTSKKYEWANLSGDYDNPKDYKRMCCSCHHKHDNTIFNIKHMRIRGGDV